MAEATLSERIKVAARALGFELVGIAPAEPGPHAAFLEEWLARGYAAGMAYLGRDPEKRQDPRKVVPDARAVVVCGMSYYPGPEPEGTGAVGRGIVARYARGNDYHDVLGEKLQALLAFIQAQAPAGAAGRAYVDTGPVLEREVGALAGLGQFGKNTTLISRALGSYFFLGVVITTLALEPDPPASWNLCGSCTRCLDACPTGALRAPYELDARLCISYLTIEHRGSIPRELRAAIGDRVFGCDICQEVCPWNRRAQPCREPALAPRPEAEAPLLAELLALSQEEFSRRFRGSAVKRAKCQGLRRNAAVALGNTRDPAYAPVLTRALADPDPVIREHASWALEQVGGE
ncbi:MAG: tRNA epoxyqueuosine(34) reductase QueG [Armatimonadetes bacterium]|nr:tRNA epoxyqueuosine(34) reductase QueG [Armatimonadota bacterium]